MCASVIVGGKYVANTVAELSAFIGREIGDDQDVCLCGTDVRKELEAAGYKVEHDPFDWIATKIESEVKQ